MFIYVLINRTDFSSSFLSLFSSVNVDDLVLVDVLEDVRRVHEDAHGAHGGHDEEHVQLQAVHHHCNELPVFADLLN